MKNYKEISLKARKEQDNWANLKEILKDDKLTYDQAKILREQQNNSYNKWKFYKEMMRRLNK